MSVKGFRYNGQIHKYLYDALEGVPESGQDIFFATYGETPASEIWNKCGPEKKAVAVIYQGYTYWLVGLDTVVYKECYFSTPVYGDSFLTIHVVGTTWNAPQTVTLAKKSSPTFTGTPKAPTAASGTSTTQIATTAFVQQEISTAEQQHEEVTVSTAGAVTQALDAGKLYHFTGALTALTITLNVAPSGQLAQYHFDFDCGSTAPTVTLPSTVILPDSNSFDAGTHYEVDILNNYGVVMAWATS